MMISQLANLNWISVLAAFVAYFLLGAVWYMVIFVKLYKVALGKENEVLQNQSPIFIIGPAICVLISVITSAILIYTLNINSYAGGSSFALIIGFGYLVANTTNIAINPNIPKPFLYSFITSGYHLVGMIISCLILVAMK